MPPGVVGARPHVHHAHDETFVVLAGELTVSTDDGEAVLRPGDLAHAPRGALHGFRDGGAVEVRALCPYTPPGYEQYSRDVPAAAGAGVEVTDDLLRELRARHATEALTDRSRPGTRRMTDTPDAVHCECQHDDSYQSGM
ncbi:cupin domain-containing protein [Geodermatophilus sp. SYSU D01119]